MVDAIVSPLLELLTSFAVEEAKEQVRLVTGVGQELKRLAINLQAIQVVLDNAEERQFKDKGAKRWLDELKEVSYEMEDVLDKLLGDGDTAIAFQKKVCSCFPASCFGITQLRLRHEIAHKIKDLNGMLDDISTQKDKFELVKNASYTIKKPERVPTTSLIEEKEICGRDSEKNKLLLLLSENSEQKNGLHIISIVGLGGIGKTTLAQLACNDDEVKKKFDEIIWVCVSDPFEVTRVAKAIIEAVDGSATSLVELQSLMNHIHKSIQGKKVFLVLDDVWDGDYNKWEPFYRCLKNSHRESKILITTRKDTVARMMESIDIIPVNVLAEEECWKLFKRLAFSGKSIEDCEILEQIGKKITCKCKGLPLAVKTIGSLLRSKRTLGEWQRILDSEMWKVEEIERGLLAPLLMSYHDLPSRIKQCFLYCAVFPKGYNFYKEELITLWMAQGYLSVEDDKEMEMIGEEYFTILATRSFFQEFKHDGHNNVLSCRMHDLVHDFAQFLRKNERLSIAINGSEKLGINALSGKICHLMSVMGLEVLFPTFICKIKRLCSLLCDGPGVDYLNLNLQELFEEMTCLRVLLVMGNLFAGKNLIEEIPINIEKLVNLKYLNLSCQDIVTLPETLCELYNLQKLDVSECENLRELPKGIGKLINMRSLLNDETPSLKYMPIGIGRLTSLRKLSKFAVGGDFDGRKACRLESLKNLELLRECGIEGLGNVSDVGEDKRLVLDKMKHLVNLDLSFDDEQEGNRNRKNEDDEQLLQVLQTPLNLKELRIQLYRGITFPIWLMSLTNLKSLILDMGINCEYLPPLGKLPSLERLEIVGLKSVKRVGNEFLGIESGSDLSSSSSVIAFPKLKSLEFKAMYELEEWDCGITRNGNISIMPHLSFLTIGVCPKLKVLPDYHLQTTTPQLLQIIRCPILKERMEGEDRHKISHIPRISIR